MEKVIKKEDLQIFLEELKKKYEIIGPTKKGGGTSTYTHTTFSYINNIEELDMNYKSSMLSPKKILFPDYQALYRYKISDEGVSLEDMRDTWNKDKIIFGLHPCDIAAISCLDKVFLEDNFRDEYYQERRNKSIIIGLTCAETHEHCFCNVVGSGPDGKGGYDLLMTDIGENYFIKAGSEIGNKLISSGYFKSATDKDRVLRKELLSKVTEKLPRNIDIKKIYENMETKYNDKLWDEFSDTCLTCGACNMTCPTCHCFTITDSTNSTGTEGKRILAWDSCHFERFAQMAGNFSTREERSSRFKHRMYDKFYYDHKRYGNVFCVGCGRCIEFCPSHMDILAALRKLQED